MGCSRALIRFTTVVVAAAMLAGSAIADLAAYNAAVRRADFQAAAAEAKATWPTLDKSREDLALIAREFGWSAMLAGEPAIARGIMTSLAAPGTSVDTAPELSAVLLAWADFEIAPAAQTRDVLASALKARIAKPSEDLMTVRAAQKLFQYDWTNNEYADAMESADLGAKASSEMGTTADDITFNMRRNGLIAGFVRHPQRADFIRLRELEREIAHRFSAETGPKLRKNLGAQAFHTAAWRAVEGDVLKRMGVNLPVMKDDEIEQAAYQSFFPAPGDPSLPVCRIEIEQRGEKLKYPKPALSKGLPGFAFYSYEPGEDGVLKSVEVLGSAPHESFTETIDEILPNWRWRFAKNSPRPPACRMPSRRPIEFLFSLNPPR